MAQAEATGAPGASEPLCNPAMLPWWLKDPTGSDIVREVSAMTRRLEATPPSSPTKDTGREHSPTFFLSLFSGQNRASHHNNSRQPSRASGSCSSDLGAAAGARPHPRHHPIMPTRTQSASEQSGYDADEEDVQVGDPSAMARERRPSGASGGGGFHSVPPRDDTAGDSPCQTPAHRPSVGPHSPPSSPLATPRTTMGVAVAVGGVREPCVPNSMRARVQASSHERGEQCEHCSCCNCLLTTDYRPNRMRIRPYKNQIITYCPLTSSLACS